MTWPASSLISSRNWKANNPERAKSLTSEWRERNRVRQIYLLCKGHAKRKGLEFDLDMAELERRIEPMRCERTGHKLEWSVYGQGRGLKQPWQPSIDRRDNSKGYTMGNIQVVSTIYNFSKSIWTDEVVAQFRGEPDGH